MRMQNTKPPNQWFFSNFKCCAIGLASQEGFSIKWWQVFLNLSKHSKTATNWKQGSNVAQKKF
jgi:hypothetical protein